MKMKTVLVFDFDGTIADSLTSVIKVLDKLSNEYGYRKATKEYINNFRNKGIQEMFKSLKITPAKLPVMINKARKELSEEVKNFKPVEGLKEILIKLKGQGYTLGILTSNTEFTVKTYLRKNKISLFDFIYSNAGLFGKDKIIKQMLNENQIDINEVVYFGDEVRDIEDAKKAKIKIIAVAWGYNKKELLNKHKPDDLIKEPKDIINSLKKLRGVENYSIKY